MIDMVTRRKGEMTSMETRGDRVYLIDIPRGIIGLKINVPLKASGRSHHGPPLRKSTNFIKARTSAAEVNLEAIALESGTAFAYAINNLQDRGKFFIEPQDAVYAGQIVGEHIHENDQVNVTG